LTLDNGVTGGKRGMNRIGRDYWGHAFTGVLHELMVFNRVLELFEIEALEEHLAKEWK